MRAVDSDVDSTAETELDVPSLAEELRRATFWRGRTGLLSEVFCITCSDNSGTGVISETAVKASGGD
jgi:hypothetical protein